MAKFGIGQSVRRVEDPRLLTGGGRYTDDTKLNAPALRAYVLRSPHAHADIRTIDTAAAKAAPGVRLVLTGEDVKKAGFGDLPCLVPIENRDGTQRADTPRPMLAQGRVRHVGDPVALVVADTLEQAKDASELIEIDYEAAPAHRRHLRIGAARRAAGRTITSRTTSCSTGRWATAPGPMPPSPRPTRSCKLQIVNNRLIVNSMEPRGAICEYDRQGRPLDPVGVVAGRQRHPPGAGRDGAEDRPRQAARCAPAMSAAASA